MGVLIESLRGGRYFTGEEEGVLERGGSLRKG